MMKRFAFVTIVCAAVALLFACKRDDDEPTREIRSISRLYISTSDYNPSGGNTFYNLYIMDPADSSVFAPTDMGKIYGFKSSARGGGAIHYTPYSDGMVFQGSQNTPSYLDTAIQVMAVSPTGILKNTNSLANRKFNNVKGLFYTIVREGVLNEDYLTITNSDTLYVVNRPRSAGFYTKARYHMPLDYLPWSVWVNDRDVLVSSYSDVDLKPNSQNGIVVYKNLASKYIENKEDSLLTATARVDLKIDGAENIRGMSYSKEKDIMVVTDFSGEGAQSVGRILFFDNFSTHTESKTIKPSRVLTTSKLKQPYSVAIDTRAKGKYLYVADVIAKRVFRFLITDDGVTDPDAEINLFNRTPYSISLDAR